jgi:excisionase family DNA binding protein
VELSAPNRQLLTIPETARKCAVSVETVRRLIARGELPALRVGGQVRIDPDELAEFLYREPDAAA